MTNSIPRLAAAACMGLALLACDPTVTPPSLVASPLITPLPGAYESEVTVSVTCPTDGAEIRYTTNGDEPSSSNGTVIPSGGSFVLSGTATVKAIAYKEGMSPSAVVSSSFTVTVVPWFDAAYQYRRRIVIPASQVSDGPLADFPLLVTGECLDAAFFSHVSKGTAANLDVIFISGAAKLDREIVSYSQAGKTLEAWVRVPSLSSAADTVIWVYYGNGAANEPNAAAAWSSGYKAVWHLDTVPTAAMADATANGNAATAQNMNAANRVAGRIGSALTFNGTTQYLSAPNTASLQVTGALTVSAWIKLGSTTANQVFEIISKKSAWNGANGYEMDVNPGASANRIALNGGGADQALAGNLNAGTGWMYVAGTVSGTTAAIYVNGENRTTDAVIGALTADTQALYIGGQSGIANYFNGQIDECRVQSVARSSGWIRTEYANQSSPGAFVTVKPEETP